MSRDLAIEVDLPATRRRLARLHRYIGGSLLDGNAFICAHYRECRRSRQPGELATVVGAKALAEDHPEGGGRPSHVRVPSRVAILRVVPSFVSRLVVYGVVPRLERHLPTELRRTSRLRPAGLLTDHHDPQRTTTNPKVEVPSHVTHGPFPESVIRPTNGRAFHIFDGFALVNRLLCSAGPKGSSEGHPTKTMFRNCEVHFRATMSILQPTLVIVQGGRVDRQIRKVFERTRSFTENLHDARFEGQRVLVCTFSHPSARGSLRWGDSLAAPYLNEVVVPTLKKAVRRL